MNTEIFDYLKTLSKKEYFYINFFNSIFGIIIIVSAIIFFRQGASMLQYAIMFGSATMMLGLNSYKCFKRKSKNGWVFLIMCLVFLAITGLAVYCTITVG